MSSNSWSEQDGRRGSQNSITAPRFDAEDHLSKMFNDGMGDKLEQMLYQPSNNATSNNPRAGAWSTNKAPSAMGNGKDFFAELRKQVTSLTEKEKAGG